jgi:hypothetical protein
MLLIKLVNVCLHDEPMIIMGYITSPSPPSPTPNIQPEISRGIYINLSPYSKAHINAPTIAGNKLALAIVLAAPESTTALVNTLLKLISELLKQFDELTSATSFGSANVISTHYSTPLAQALESHHAS